MKKPLAFAAIATVLMLASCNNSDFDGYKKAESGLHYKFYVHSDSEPTATEGDGMVCRYTIKKKSTDSLIFDSKLSSRDGSGNANLLVNPAACAGGVEDAFKMLAKGDSASFIVSADSFFLKTNRMNSLPPFIKPGEHLEIFVKVVDIKTKKELEEKRRIAQSEMEKDMKERQMNEQPLLVKYLSDNKLNPKPTKSGLIFIEEVKGSGKEVKAGDRAMCHYVGTFIDGTELDNSYKRGQPLPIEVGQGQVIPGWEEALLMMKKGGKAKLIIPSNLAWGAEGYQGVPPYSTVVFTVEVVDIVEGAAAGK